MEGKVEITNVIVHPIVLLSIVDHYNRLAKNSSNKRVVGTLLGEVYEESESVNDVSFSAIKNRGNLNKNNKSDNIYNDLLNYSYSSVHVFNEEEEKENEKVKDDCIEEIVVDEKNEEKNKEKNNENNSTVKKRKNEKKIKKFYIHITNSFAVPFEEDARDSTVWFFDTNYHENLFHMFKKVNARERIVGWYSSGPRIKPADLEIHQIYNKYCHTPVYLIVDVLPKDLALPIDAYYSAEEATSDKTFRRTFVHIPSTIGAYEAEEVGVEHLLRELKNASTSTLANQVNDKLTALKILSNKLKEISEYIQLVIRGTLPHNNKILYNLQNVFNLLSDFDSNDIVSAFCVQTNDALLAIYLGSVVRATMGLHALINNMIENKQKYKNKIKDEHNGKDKDKKDKTKKEANENEKPNTKK